MPKIEFFTEDEYLLKYKTVLARIESIQPNTKKDGNFAQNQ